MEKEGYPLSKRDSGRVQAMLIWFEKQRKKPPLRRRRTAGGGGGGGGGDVTWAKVVRGLQYADPEGEPPAGYATYKFVPLSATEYDSEETYTPGDIVYLENEVEEITDVRAYTCILEATGQEPPNETYWSDYTGINPQVASLEGVYPATSADMRDFGRWYYPDDIVPFIQRNGTYYFAQQMIPLVNSEGEGSLRWNETEQRLMAVYR